MSYHQLTDNASLILCFVIACSLWQEEIKSNLENYIKSFFKDAREIFEFFNFTEFLGQLNDDDLLFKIVQKVCQNDLSLKAIFNHDMGLVFEDLIRRFAEGSLMKP